MADLQNRTLICSVLFIDIVEYSRKPVVEQIELKDRFNALLSDALKGVAVNDRIILDTGDGAAISFIGDPEDALFVATGMRDEIATRAPSRTVELLTRMGINLGPVRLVKDINGQANIIGDGINVAQRVMSFAKPGQVLVSRSYYEVVSRLSDESSKLFSYEGSRTDKHIREHEVYAIGAIPALHRRYDDSASPGWTTNADAASAGGLVRATQIARNVARGVIAKPRRATLIAVVAILATAVGARAWREPPPQRDATLLGKTTSLDEGRLSARVFEPKATEPEPMRGTPAAAPPVEAAPAAAVEPAPPAPTPPTPRVGAFRDAEPPPQQRRASAPSRAEPKAGPVVVLADPKAAQPVEKPLPQAAEAELALLALAITPWGQVFVDGRPRGVSPPLQEIELTPGRHRIELRNTASETHVITVNAKPGERLRIKHKFN
jgi:class 3 adenylate cyclase